MGNETIKCKFSLLNEGRKYTGHHRKYILESARTVCYAPETREGIQLREKFGFLGHGRRMLTGKLQLGETELVRLPNGQSILLENIPSNVTTFFEVSQNGDVEHHQDILTENAPGKMVLGLSRDRVGGFSWACGGGDGGAIGVTKINSFEGFDYVYNPGFSANRGYILESADANTKDMILENIGKLGVENPEQRLESWISSVQFYAAELEEKINQAAVYESALQEQIEKQSADSAALLVDASKLQADMEKMVKARARIITECASKSVVVIPDRVQQAIISMASEADFYELVSFFEAAKAINLNQFPVGDSPKSIPLAVTAAQRRGHPEYGSADAGVDFSGDSFINF